MSSFAERSRNMLIEQLTNDPRVGGEKVISAAALMRGSFVMLVLSGILGAFVVQIIFDAGGLQFGIGLGLGYLAYIALFYYRSERPRFIAAMATLTDKRFLLLGSKRVGIAGDWKLSEVEDLKLIRKGNIFMMGKVGLHVVGEERRRVFFIANRKMGYHLVESYDELTGKA